MDHKENSVQGAVSILHTVQDGKHYYDVDGVFGVSKSSVFFRTGDKIEMINNRDLQDVLPDTFAMLLTEGCPMLTIHNMRAESPLKKHKGPGCFHPDSKEEITLDFSMYMVQEADLDSELEETCSPEPDVKLDIDEDSSDESNHFLLVTMTETTIASMSSRGCGEGCNSPDCKGDKCTSRDMLIRAENSQIARVSRGTALEDKTINCAIRSLANQNYLSLKYSRVCLTDTNSAKITIYFYKTIDGGPSQDYKGSLVVLNCTGTNKFLKCTREGERRILVTEKCDKNMLKNFYTDDPEILPFLFYMRAESSGNRVFQSANCKGWFIRTNVNEVEMDSRNPKNENFVFIISI